MKKISVRKWCKKNKGFLLWGVVIASLYLIGHLAFLITGDVLWREISTTISLTALFGAIPIMFLWKWGHAPVKKASKKNKKEETGGFPLRRVFVNLFWFFLGYFILFDTHISLLFIWTLGWIISLYWILAKEENLNQQKVTTLFWWGIVIWVLVAAEKLIEAWREDWWGNIGEFFGGALLILLGIALGALGLFILYKLGQLFIKIYKKVDRWADRD